jgi:vacuolar iron transporter family protein
MAHRFEENHQHRDLRGGAVRAAIFGVSDGLVTNLSLILGVAGANADPGTIRLAGLAGLVAGAFSMAAGEFVSMAAQKELWERELELERQSLALDASMEKRELVAIYVSRGVSLQTAENLSGELMKNPELALETHMREELGIDIHSLGVPSAAAASSLAAFGIGAVIPLAPWFVADGTLAIVASITLAALSSLIIGSFIGISTGRPPWRSALRQLAIGALAGVVTYGIGAMLGVRVS